MDDILLNTLDPDRRRAAENVRAAAERIWSRPLHRYYTDHTVAHSERVIALLDGLTAGVMATGRRLVPTEVFVLLAAAYLHDIGMQDERFASGDLEEIRAHHHERTAEMILTLTFPKAYRALTFPKAASFREGDSGIDLGLPDDPGLVEAVALVAKGHRRVDLRAAEYEPLVHGGETVRLRLLAALLRFADELDIDHRRVDLELMKLLALPVESQLHWWRCHYVSGVGISDEYIRVAYRFPRDRPDYEGLIVPLVEGEIRARHAALEEIFRADAVKVALGRPQVRLMHLVQPLPPPVEALARRQGEAGEQGGGGAEEQGGGAPVPAGEAGPQAPPSRPARGMVVDMRGATVGTQVNVKGDYVDRRSTVTIVGDGNVVGDRSRSHVVKGRSPVTAEETVTGPGGVAGVAWDTAAIRQLLAAAFDDEEITTLCFDRFHPVYEDFGSGMSKRQKIQRLLDYCVRHRQVEALLALVRERNPAQYARFEGRLKGLPGE